MENCGGFIKLFRQILDWEWYDDLPTCRLFIHLLLKANYAERNWHGQTIERGSCITSYATLASETGLSQEQIKRALKNLTKTGEIKRIATNKNTVICVVKYADFQGFGFEYNEQTTSKEQAENKQKTNEQQTNNKQTTTTKEIKNKRNKESKNIYTSLPEDKNITAIVETVIQMLNVETDKKDGEGFSPRAKKNVELISTLIHEGYTVNDLKTVIEKKCDSWLTDPVMKSNLRPSVLFGDKFDEYLHE
jgi:uncharacterized phage protein (TIGR02220 family)